MIDGFIEYVKHEDAKGGVLLRELKIEIKEKKMREKGGGGLRGRQRVLFATFTGSVGCGN
ncbi:hypothetical protein QJS10_CPB14g01559 [Acorus calamus]|uniref:Uncharacterized protein n=1 Tax=Acorus calamus TaxID=4465 RepID=A0AAV9DCT8_ACOCL|nr:hypothetical protein QJS10_CPB14g01559 [Acorus calamus]